MKYYLGYETSQDYRRAAMHFRLSAEMGNPESQYKLAELYDKGIGVQQHFVTAYAWYKTASLQNYIPAKINLEIISQFMTQTQINKAEEYARILYKKYAETPMIQRRIMD